MIKVVGIRFRKAGKIYYFDPGKLEIKPGQHVIVETVRGVEYGSAVLGNRDILDDEVVQPLKKGYTHHNRRRRCLRGKEQGKGTRSI